MSSLPPGVTDQMIEDHVNGPPCDNCGHYAVDHYDEGDEIKDDAGNVLEACNIVNCVCKKYESQLVNS